MFIAAIESKIGYFLNNVEIQEEMKILQTWQRIDNFSFSSIRIIWIMGLNLENFCTSFGILRNISNFIKLRLDESWYTIITWYISNNDVNLCNESKI